MRPAVDPTAPDGSRIGDVAAGMEAMTMPAPTGKTISLAISPDGRTLAIGTQETGVRFWSLAEQNGATIASSSLDMTVRLGAAGGKQAVSAPRSRTGRNHGLLHGTVRGAR